MTDLQHQIKNYRPGVNIEKRVCPQCEGRQRVITPIWEEFWNQPEEVARSIYNGNLATLVAWMRSKGAMIPLNSNSPLEYIPASETDCPRCKGTGLMTEAEYKALGGVLPVDKYRE